MRPVLRRPLAGLLGTSLILVGVAAPAAAATPDAWLTIRVKIALIRDPQVHAADVHVDTDEGRVTLYGKVGSTDEQLAATRLAATQAGVLGVRDLLQVVPEHDRARTEVADAEVARRVVGALHDEWRLAGSEITVSSVDDGVVLLAGRAASPADHLLALELTQRIPGVRHVASDVTPGDSSMGSEEWYRAEPDSMHVSLSDTWITARAKFAFMTDPVVPARDVHVDTRDGVVTLFGVAPSAGARQRAVRLARAIRGVRQVEDDLAVAAPGSVGRAAASDRSTQALVADRLASAGLEGARIRVGVRRAVARLTGTIRRPVDRYDAVRIASGTPGISLVRDELRLRP